MDQRRQPRLAVDETGTLFWSEGAVVASSTIAVCDVTDDGVQIRVPQAIRVGEIVRVRGKVCEFLGTVRYCRLEGDAWTAGIQLAGPAYSRQSDDYQD